MYPRMQAGDQGYVAWSMAKQGFLATLSQVAHDEMFVVEDFLAEIPLVKFETV
jgi:hypothetical protein